MADDKTRILTAAEAARLFSRKPKVVGDRVVFYCDNGHRVVAPVSDGGKRGACSKCGAPVQVPTATAGAEDIGEATMILAAPKPATGTATDEHDQFQPPVIDTSEGSPAEERDAMVGSPEAEERLPTAGSAADAGLESPQETVAVEAAAAAAGTGATGEGGADPSAAPAESGEGWQFMPGDGTPAAGESSAAADANGLWPGFGHAEADAEGFDNPTARLVARLWVEHELGGTLELHLQDGSVIFPQSYEPRWSLGTHGLFAAAAADGSITLTAVAWDSVQKIIVRNVKGLPDGMFE